MFTIFQYMKLNNKLPESRIKKTIPFTIASKKKIKDLEINLSKVLKDFMQNL